jgi:transglutaminase-like putative cysteine protease
LKGLEIMKFPRSLLCLCFALVCLLLSAPRASAGGDDWRAIDPAELAMKTSVVEKDADAEVLFWEVRVDDSTADLVLNHYVRIKIFTERGKDSQSKVQIPFGNFFGAEIKIKDIAARTIKQDGSIVELKKEDVFESTQVKVSGAKVKVKSFAVPGIVPGAVVEYRWREERIAVSANRMHLDYQRDLPVQRITYWLKPSPSIVGTLRVQMFNGPLPPTKKEKDGFYSFTMTNVPAFQEEPYMPPEDQVRTWMFVYYTIYEKIDPLQYWHDRAKAMFEASKEWLKTNDQVRTATAEAVGDATSPEEKLRRIFEYCRTKIKNVNDPGLGLTAEQRAKVKENKTPSDTLKRGIGTGFDIDTLFAALCVAAGFDARVTATSDRGRVFFRQDFGDSYFLRGYNVAVKLGDQWKVFDPATTYAPFGMLRWQEEGVQALLPDAKETTWVKTEISPPEKSLEKRTAELTLSEDGTLEGDVSLEYIGHSAADMKNEYDEKSENEREKELIDQIKGRMSTAEITKMRVENVIDRTKPFAYSYHVKVPGYAQRTGKRLFLQPGFFTHGNGPTFTANQRKNGVYFHYPWAEHDEITIELPTGFVLDNPDAPASIRPETTNGICGQTIKIAVTKDNRRMTYKRDFFFGGGGTILFPVDTYNGVKQLFDVVQQSDDHTITLKQVTASSSN